MAPPADPVILSAVAAVTARRVDPSVYSVLEEVISAMGKPPLRRLGMFFARLQVAFVFMAVSAEGSLVAGIAKVGRL